MIDIKKAKNFNGIRGIMSSEEFDSIMYCLNCGINYCKENEKDSSKYEKLQKTLSTMSYFDKEYKEVHIQLGYSELETLTNAMFLFLIPYGECDLTFNKCIENPNTKIWITKEEKSINEYTGDINEVSFI